MRDYRMMAAPYPGYPPTSGAMVRAPQNIRLFHNWACLVKATSVHDYYRASILTGTVGWMLKHSLVTRPTAGTMSQDKSRSNTQACRARCIPSQPAVCLSRPACAPATQGRIHSRLNHRRFSPTVRISPPILSGVAWFRTVLFCSNPSDRLFAANRRPFAFIGWQPFPIRLTDARASQLPHERADGEIDRTVGCRRSADRYHSWSDVCVG